MLLSVEQGWTVPNIYENCRSALSQCLKKIKLVVDNLNIHTGAALYELLEPAHARKILEKNRISLYTQAWQLVKYGEIELSHLFRQCLNRRLENMERLKVKLKLG